MVGMSGGVDSSVTALVLKKQGYSLCGATLFLCGNSDEKNAQDSLSVCNKLGIEHFIFDLKTEFSETVINDFIAEYKRGNTPNPCIVCNRCIKFGEMIDLALQNGCNKIATGHYARVEKSSNGRFLLKKAVDESKDQSYVLYMLTQEQLSRVVLPLGEYSKSEVRALALESELICADRPDSQDICFVPEGEYINVIKSYTNKAYPQGDFVDILGNKLGTHGGIINYTVGQRKGLGVAFGEKMYVKEKNVHTNEVVLAKNEDLFSNSLDASHFNWIAFDNPPPSIRAKAKVRYSTKEDDCTVFITGKSDVHIEFDSSQRAIAKGQAVVLYDGDIVIGGGTIS